VEEVFGGNKALAGRAFENAIQYGPNITWKRVELLVPVTGDGKLVDLYKDIESLNRVMEVTNDGIVVNQMPLDILKTIYRASTSQP